MAGRGVCAGPESRASEDSGLLISASFARMVRPWAYLPKGGYSHEALLPGRAGRFRGRRPCSIGDSFYESLKRK